ncbi:MAG: hypothetical protein K0S51_996 [Bacillales bacterium]|jgi:hypothetical protein|nr:hypothetical protein [Bacillales bacterium]
MSICPQCNGLNMTNYDCHFCGNELKELGRISDLFDDYSAYVEYDLDESYKSTCTHSFFCPNCKGYENIDIEII